MAQILNPSDSAVSQLNAIETQIDKTFYGTEPLQHSFYRTNFNGVDLHDRYWYKISYNYQIRNWHSAFFFCLLKVAVVNAWVLHNEIELVSLENYLSQLAGYLLKPQS